MKNILKRITAGLLTSVVLTGLVAAPSFAWGQDGGAGGGGGGTGGGSNSPPTSGTPNPNGGTSGGGGGTALPSNIITKRYVPNTGIGAGFCAFSPRDDGAEAIGSDVVFRIEYAENTSGPESPPSGGGWVYLYATPNGSYMFQRTTPIDFKCLYPSRTTTVVVQCVIKTDVDLQQKAPVEKQLAYRTDYSGWNAYSSDYQGCVNSKTRAGVDIPLPLGYFESTLVNTFQNAIVAVATTPNDITGTYDAPKVVGHSPVYQGAPQFKSAHVACPDPTKIVEPGNRFADFSMTPCSDQYKNNNAPLQQCVVGAPAFSAPVPVPLGAKQSGQFKAANPGTTHELARDGYAAKVQFNQNITGANVKVNEYLTEFRRSGSPWLAKESPSNNIWHLYAHPLDTKSLFTMMNDKTADPTDSITPEMAGKVDTVYPATNDASDNVDAPTLLTQVLKWKGSVSIQTAVASFNTNTGAITSNGTTSMTFDTNGECQSSMILSSKTTKGDSIY